MITIPAPQQGLFQNCRKACRTEFESKFDYHFCSTDIELKNTVHKYREHTWLSKYKSILLIVLSQFVQYYQNWPCRTESIEMTFFDRLCRYSVKSFAFANPEICAGYWYFMKEQIWTLPKIWVNILYKKFVNFSLVVSGDQFWKRPM